MVAREWDLARKDGEIAELKRRLVEAQEKTVSMEVDVGAERECAEAQVILETLRDNSLWLQQQGIVHVANAVLNSVELDQTVAALTVVAR
ncbi:hypothetical protein Hdeb2414_s0019g00540611 [Helianthus debilis subsp. tardiflorus]